VHGLKIYLDGALGSQGAYLSQPYAGTNERGFLLWTPEDLYKVMKTVWVSGLTFVVHAIGDEAADLVVRTGLKLQSEGVSGKLSIEHAEVIRTDTIELMKSLDVSCYMQPCHWLSDSRWLNQKLGSLAEQAFPWRKLVEAGVPVYWGSDSPIERPSLEDTRRALFDSAKAGVPAYPLEWWRGHVHPDESWGVSS